MSTRNTVWNFAAELQKWGPDRPDRPVSLAQARSYCAAVTRCHYENFTVVSLLLPRRLVPHFQAIYAYCRWADDLADETSGGAESLRLLSWWRKELQTVYAGTPTHPVMVALQLTVKQFGIPPEPFQQLLDAFEQDQRQSRYATFTELLDYCRRSANPVGRLVLYLFECSSPETERLSDEICTGLQLANFWQDVARDAAIGRVYLPQDELRQFGYAVGQGPTSAFRELLAFQVQRTRGYFERGRPLIQLVPVPMRVDMELFIRGGEAILDAIEAQRYDVLTRRPIVTKSTQLRLLAQAIGRHYLARWFYRSV